MYVCVCAMRECVCVGPMYVRVCVCLDVLLINILFVVFLSFF